MLTGFVDNGIGREKKLRGQRRAIQKARRPVEKYTEGESPSHAEVERKIYLG